MRVIHEMIELLRCGSELSDDDMEYLAAHDYLPWPSRPSMGDLPARLMRRSSEPPGESSRER